MKHKTLKNKSINRLIPILLNGFKSVLSPILSILFSYLIITYFSKNLWGNFVYYLLFFHLASIISNWGSRMFLLRSFSENPKGNITAFQEYFLARIPILILISLVIIVLFKSNEFFYLILWLIGLFVYNSLMPIIIYLRDFGKQILIEIISFISLILLINNFKNEMNISFLVKCYSFYFLIKSTLALLIYYKFLQFNSFKINLKLLKSGLPFILLALTGFLQSKIDVYTFTFFSDYKTLGEYQVVSGFFIFSQSIATIILLPYVKNIYRMKSYSILKLKNTIIKIGFFLNLLITIIIYQSLDYYFNIKLSIIQIIIGFLIGFPSYIYVTHIFHLFKQKQEGKVLKVCIIGLITNLTLSIILLSFNHEITSVLIANACAQIICTFYYLESKINDKSFKES